VISVTDDGFPHEADRIHHPSQPRRSVRLTRTQTKHPNLKLMLTSQGLTLGLLISQGLTLGLLISQGLTLGLLISQGLTLGANPAGA